MSNRPDSWHKAQYESVLAAHPDVPQTPWEHLPEDAKARIRVANDEQAYFLDSLGRAIATGGPLPDFSKD